jgi:hypothetical protein
LKKVPGLFGTKTVKKEKYLSPGDKGYKQAKKELERNKHKPISLDELIMLDIIDDD